MFKDFKPWDSCVQGDIATLSCISIVFANLLSALLVFTGLVALIMAIMGGFKFMNSGGDAKKLESARNNFIFALLGLAIIAFSYTIILIISTVTGVTCIADFAHFGFLACQ
jgi:hypothetical protein